MVNSRKVSSKYARNILSYARKPLTTSQNYSVLAYRLMLHYIEDRYDVDVHNYLRLLKLHRKGIDLKIPSSEDVLKSLEYLRNIETRKHDYYQLYLLLLASGIRLSEAQLFLDNYSFPYTDHGDVRVYTVNYQRGSKAVFYVFTPRWLRLRQDKGVRWDINGPHRKVPVKPKYIRKFFATKMFELGVSAEVIDFIQGRTPRSILARHYLNLLPQAVENYKKYARWLDDFLNRQTRVY